VVPKVKNRSSINTALDLLVRLKPDRAKLDPVIQAMMDDADDSSVYTITSYLSNGRLQVSLKTALKCWNSKNRNVRQSIGREMVLRIPPDESVKEIIEGLASADWEEVAMSADYVARHRVKQAAAPLVDALQKHAAEERARGALARTRIMPYEAAQTRGRLVAAFRALGPEELVKGWLAAGGGPSRLALVGMIGELDLKPLAGELIAALDDKDPQVRQAAARALATIPHPEAGAKLEALLKDESIPVRRAALQSLAQAKGTAATPVALAQLRSEHPDVQAMAVEVLPTMNLDLVLDELTKEAALANAMTRYALAALVAHHGDGVLHRVIARTAGKLSVDDLQAMVRLIQSARGLR
jgi:HEAT repeat protein